MEGMTYHSLCYGYEKKLFGDDTVRKLAVLYNLHQIHYTHYLQYILLVPDGPIYFPPRTVVPLALCGFDAGLCWCGGMEEWCCSSHAYPHSEWAFASFGFSFL